jgi:hypothetical protein
MFKPWGREAAVEKRLAANRQDDAHHLHLQRESHPVEICRVILHPLILAEGAEYWLD